MMKNPIGDNIFRANNQNYGHEQDSHCQGH